MPSLVREDRDGGASGAPAVAPAAWPGSRAPCGEALNASKRETAPKMRPEDPPKTTAWIGGRRKWGNLLNQALLINPSFLYLYSLANPNLANFSKHKSIGKIFSSAAIGGGRHPFPSRTRKLRRLPPMVPHRNGAGE